MLQCRILKECAHLINPTASLLRMLFDGNPESWWVLLRSYHFFTKWFQVIALLSIALFGRLHQIPLLGFELIQILKFLNSWLNITIYVIWFNFYTFCIILGPYKICSGSISAYELLIKLFRFLKSFGVLETLLILFDVWVLYKPSAHEIVAALRSHVRATMILSFIQSSWLLNWLVIRLLLKVS